MPKSTPRRKQLNKLLRDLTLCLHEIGAGIDAYPNLDRALVNAIDEALTEAFKVLNKLSNRI